MMAFFHRSLLDMLAHVRLLEPNYFVAQLSCFHDVLKFLYKLEEQKCKTFCRDAAKLFEFVHFNQE